MIRRIGRPALIFVPCYEVYVLLLPLYARFGLSAAPPNAPSFLCGWREVTVLLGSD